MTPDPVRDLAQHAEIVGDIEHRHVEAPAQIDQQLDDLLLGRDVEARGRLVEHHEIGLAGERHGDADALLLSARELVGIAMAAAARGSGRPTRAKSSRVRAVACPESRARPWASRISAT